MWEPAGRDALRIAWLTAWMTGVGLLAWVVVLGIGARALGPPPARPLRAEQWLVGLGGVVVPALLVAVLLGAGLPMTITTTSGGAPLATVVGEQWWWRIRYESPDGSVELANELILPVGIRSALKLESPDVIHSLWIPRLAGKIDLIPGRTTELHVEAMEPGAFRGVCGEFCGLSHAHMNLWATVLAPDAFAARLRREAEPIAPSRASDRGAALFLASGCGACHTVRGTPADGALGPDLTHVGARPSIAGVLPNDEAGFRAWLEDPAHLKPGAHMPPFAVLGDRDLTTIARWLESLR